MKVKRAKLCVVCEEIYEGNVCPACGNEEGIWLVNNLMTLPPGRVRKAPEPVAEKLRELRV